MKNDFINSIQVEIFVISTISVSVAIKAKKERNHSAGRVGFCWTQSVHRVGYVRGVGYTDRIEGRDLCMCPKRAGAGIRTQNE